MTPSRSLSICLALILASLSARAEFTLELVHIAPGAGELRSSILEPSFYYRLEGSGNLSTGFTPASGWMLGDGNPVTWPALYPVNPPAGTGGPPVTAGDIFSIYPFDNGKNAGHMGRAFRGALRCADP